MAHLSEPPGASPVEGRDAPVLMGTIARLYHEVLSGPVRLQDIYDRWTISIGLEQFVVYCDRDARPVGFVTWMRVDDVLIADFLAGRAHFRDPANHTGGDRVWIADLVAPKGVFPGVFKDLHDRVLKNESRLSFARMKNRRRLVKELTRERHAAALGRIAQRHHRVVARPMVCSDFRLADIDAPNHAALLLAAQTGRKLARYRDDPELSAWRLTDAMNAIDDELRSASR